MSKLIILTLIILSFIGGWFLKDYLEKNPQKAPIFSEAPKGKPLEKYTIENLAKADIKPGKLKIIEKLYEEDEFSAYLFEFEFDPSAGSGQVPSAGSGQVPSAGSGQVLKKTTGQINLPNEKGTFPVVVMLRGYIDQKLYKTGDGTRNASNFFAKNGFITIAPDFLGYAGSDSEAGNIFEARFQTYVTVLSLLKTLEEFPKNSNLISNSNQLTNQLINQLSIFLWGHSNGSQIALTVLEITGKNYPTTLWAPVSKPFPYSVLYYTDESEDRGKLIRRELAKFEQDYDVELYSLTNYLDRIIAPLQIQQGMDDDAVPVEWSNELTSELKDLEKDVTYFKYPSTDHNMRLSWDTVIERDLEFFKKYLN